AEAHDLAIRPAMRVEVGTSLAAADRQPGQGVLEDLLEAEELDDPEVDRRVEADAALVGAERGVELDPEAAVDLDIALVIDPWHPEDDLPLRLADPLDQRMFDIGGMFGHNPPEAFEHFADGLMELGFAGIAVQHLDEDGFELFVNLCHSSCSAMESRKQHPSMDLPLVPENVDHAITMLSGR